MAQRRISMRERPLAELFSSTTTGEGVPAAAQDTGLPTASGHLHRQWRRIGVVALGVATLELGIFGAVAVIVLTRPSSRSAPAVAPPTVTRTVVITQPSAAPRDARRKSPAILLVSRAQTPVLVLNGNGIKAAAATTAEIVRARGYPVTAAADAPRSDYPRSMIMYKHGFAREAARLGRDLNIPTLQPLDPLAIPGGTAARLVLIVGAGHN